MPLPCYAWLCRPTGNAAPYGFPFSTNPAEWIRAPRLVVETYSHVSRGRGRARFQLLHNTYREPGKTSTTDVWPIVAGQWVIITEGAEISGIQASTIKWIGRLEAVEEHPVAGSLHGPGSASAVGMGETLADMPLDAWAWASYDDAYGRRVMTPPTANFQRADGLIVGNAVLFADSSLPAGTPSLYVFTRKASECGTASSKLWTRKRLLEHITSYAFQGDAQRSGSDGSEVVLPYPDIAYQVDDIATVMEDTDHPEVFPLANLNVASFLDMVAPEALGLSWNIRPTLIDNRVGWSIDLSCTSTTATVAEVPDCKAPTTTVTMTSRDVRRYALSEVIGDLWDQVTVRSAPVVFGVTVGWKDRNLQKIWSDALQTDYKNAAGSGATAEQNRRERALPKYAAVGRRFVVTSTHEWDIRSQTVPISGSTSLASGTSYGGGVVPLIPAVKYTTDGDRLMDLGNALVADLSLDLSLSRAPYQPTSRILPFVPWPKGVVMGSSVISDSRTDDEKARPCWLEPRLFRFVNATTTWTDLLRQDLAESPQIHADDAGLILDIAYDKQEYLLLNKISGWYGLLSPTLDWQEIALTLGIESDQRLESTRYRRSTRADSVPSRILIIDRPDLGLWILRKNAVLGINSDGSAHRFAPYDVCVRNDWPTLDRLAATIAASVFTTRRAATLEVRGDRQPTWMALGQGIDWIVDGIASHEVNSVVVEIVRQVQGEPGWTVRTSAALTVPPNPSRTGPDQTWNGQP